LLKLVKKKTGSTGGVIQALQEVKDTYKGRFPDSYISSMVENERFLKLAEQDKKKKTMYVVRQKPAIVPKICTHCLKPTEGTETLVNVSTEVEQGFGRRTTTHTTERVTLGLCNECRKNRKERKARPYTDSDGQIYGIMFENKEYADYYWMNIISLNKDQITPAIWQGLLFCY